MGKPLNVLIADDSEDDVLLIARALGRGGYDVNFCQVDCPEDFEAELASHPWDVILSDHLMPGFGSLEVLTIAKQHLPNLPVIVVSGLAGESHQRAALEAGAYAHVGKDNLGALAVEIDRALFSTTSQE